MERIRKYEPYNEKKVSILMTEEWRTIQEFPQNSVSDFGRIKNNVRIMGESQ